MGTCLINDQVWFCLHGKWSDLVLERKKLNGKWLGLVYRFSLNVMYALGNTRSNPADMYPYKCWVLCKHGSSCPMIDYYLIPLDTV